MRVRFTLLTDAGELDRIEVEVDQNNDDAIRTELIRILRGSDAWQLTTNDTIEIDEVE